MQSQFKFRINAVALGVLTAFGAGQAIAASVDLTNTNDSVHVYGTDNSGTPLQVTGVSVEPFQGDPFTIIYAQDNSGTQVTTKAGAASGDVASIVVNDGGLAATNSSQTYVKLQGGSNSTLTVSGAGIDATGGINNNNGGITNVGAIAGATTINASGAITGTGGATITGTTNINASINAATNINTGSSTSAVTMGNTGVNTTNTVTAYSGNTTMSLTNNTASLTAGSSLATNGTTGVTSGAGSGGLTVYNAAQTIVAGTSIPTNLSPNGILAGKTYQNKINGNLLVDGNVYINGTLDYVSSNTANTTVIGSTTGVGASVLTGATVATNGGTAIVLKGATGTQTVVDANGKLTNVVGTATQSTAALTLTNGIGNTHGLVITETQATLSGGTHSSSLTMGDNGGTFSDSATGAPVQVHGVNDGTNDFDAVNVRQFASAIASVTAMANIPQVDQDKTVAVGMALGSFMGKTALAAGVTYRFTKNGVLKGSVSSAMNSSQSTAVGVGAAWSY